MNKSKIIIPVTVVVLLVGGIIISSFRTDKERKNNQLVANSGFVKTWGKEQIVIGLDDAFPPIGFRDVSGKIVGFDVDLARETFDRMGLKAVFQPVVWDSVIMSLNKKDIDVIWNGMTITEKRKEQIIFSKPYLRGENVFIVRDDGLINGKNDLTGKTVGLQNGSEQDETLKNDPFVKSLKEIRTYDTVQAAFLDMKTGRVDSVFVDNFTGLFTANQVLGEIKVKAVRGDYGVTYAGVGLRKSDTGLKSEIDRVIDEMKADGTVSRIANRWFGSDEVIVK